MRCLLVLFALWALLGPSSALAMDAHVSATDAEHAPIDPAAPPAPQAPEDEDQDDDDGSDDPRIARVLPPTVFPARAAADDASLEPLHADPPETPPPRC